MAVTHSCRHICPDIPQDIPVSGCYHCVLLLPNLKIRTNEARNLDDLLKVSQLVSGKVRTREENKLLSAHDG